MKSFTLRSAKRGDQWLRWFLGMLVALVVYVTLERLSGGHAPWDLSDPDNVRLLLPVVLFLALFMRLTRLDSRLHHAQDDDADKPSSKAEEQAPETEPDEKSEAAPPALQERQDEPPAPAPIAAEATAAPEAPPPEATPPASPLFATARKATAAIDPNDPDFDLDAFWGRTRKMPHNFIPVPETDKDYLTCVHLAADKGHVEAISKLAGYALRRNLLVEAYFWGALAQAKGHENMSSFLSEVRKRWVLSGAPGEYENEYPAFPAARAAVSRALLRIACGVNAPYGRTRLAQFLAAGNEDALALQQVAARTARN